MKGIPSFQSAGVWICRFRQSHFRRRIAIGHHRREREMHFMVPATSNFRFFTGVALSGMLLALAGCQSNSGDVLNVQDKQAASGEKVLASELNAYCPTLTLREGTAYFN